MAKDYTQEIKLKTSVDLSGFTNITNSLKGIDKQVNQSKKALVALNKELKEFSKSKTSKGLFSATELKSLQSAINQQGKFNKLLEKRKVIQETLDALGEPKNKTQEKAREKLQKALTKINERDDIKKYEKDKKKEAIAGAAAGLAMKGLEKAAKLVTAGFKKLIAGIAEAVTAMLDFKSGVATYDVGSSLISNAAARETQLKYGLSGSQAFAFDKARGMLNIQSDEDLMYMNSQQRERLLSYMERYSAWYDKMESSGVLAEVQEMQLDFEEFKQQIAMDFLEWVAANKETIMSVLKGLFNVVKFIADVILTIARIFGSDANYNSAAKNSDTLATNVNNNQRNTTINITSDTSYSANGTSNQTAQQQFEAQDKQKWNTLAKQIATAVR